MMDTSVFQRIWAALAFHLCFLQHIQPLLGQSYSVPVAFVSRHHIPWICCTLHCNFDFTLITSHSHSERHQLCQTLCILSSSLHYRWGGAGMRWRSLHINVCFVIRFCFYFVNIFFCFTFRQRFCYVALVGFQFTAIFLQLLECWDYRHTPHILLQV